MKNDANADHEHPLMGAALVCTLALGFVTFVLLLAVGTRIFPAYFFASLASSLGFLMPAAMIKTRRLARSRPAAPENGYSAQFTKRR